MLRPILVLTLTALLFSASHAQEIPTLEVVWPPAGASVELGSDPEKVIGVVVRSNLALLPPALCGESAACGHVHIKIDGDACDIPGRTYNSTNSDFGGDLIKARLGHCPEVFGPHLIDVFLADQHHQPILVGGTPLTAQVEVTTTP